VFRFSVEAVSMRRLRVGAIKASIMRLEIATQDSVTCRRVAVCHPSAAGDDALV